MTCNHSYAGGKCIYCGSPQQRFNGSEEVKLSNIKYSHKIAPQARFGSRKRINSEFQSVVDEVMVYLHEDVYKKGLFSRYCGIIKKVGINQARIWIKEMRGRGITNPRYFMGIYKNFNKTK